MTCTCCSLFCICSGLCKAINLHSRFVIGDDVQLPIKIANKWIDTSYSSTNTLIWSNTEGKSDLHYYYPYKVNKIQILLLVTIHVFQFLVTLRTFVCCDFWRVRSRSYGMWTKPSWHVEADGHAILHVKLGYYQQNRAINGHHTRACLCPHAVVWDLHLAVLCSRSLFSP